MSWKRIVGGVMVLPFLLSIFAGSITGFGFLFAVLGMALICSTYMGRK